MNLKPLFLSSNGKVLLTTISLVVGLLLGITGCQQKKEILVHIPITIPNEETPPPESIIPEAVSINNPELAIQPTQNIPTVSTNMELPPEKPAAELIVQIPNTCTLESATNQPLKNTWTSELEAEFQQRAKQAIQYYTTGQSYGTTANESEKRSYPRAMFDFLAGNRAKALGFLQQEDADANINQHTAGIDYYYAFTLKQQIRKYFLLGQFLDPNYKQRMFTGAKAWTEKEPLNRPHPIFGNGDGKSPNWDQKTRGGWVDGRNTDNLRSMREVAVYLMAEETGNEATRRLYQQKIQRYVTTLYQIGMGEWDSENYLGHNFAAYLNLYDFAKDDSVKQLAKAALDWMSTAAALKYYRGGWGGVNKRDYGRANVVFGSAAARTFWIYFGDNQINNPEPELDTLFLITSDYRPPQAVVALARKKIPLPVEIFSTKPLYENWKPSNDKQPGYWETSYYGNTYQMGSLASTFADADVAPFKLTAINSQRGVDYFVVNTDGSWVQPGKHPGDEIAQFRNLLIWLRPISNKPFFFQFPKTAKTEIEENIWFIQLEKTWLAIRPINLINYRPVNISVEKFAQVYQQETTVKAITQGNSYAGFALEVGEAQSHGSYQNFKQSIKAKNRLDVKNLAQGKVILTGVNGDSLELGYNTKNLLPLVKRNGKNHDWLKNFAVYNSLLPNQIPVYLGWKKGYLKIQSRNQQFATGVNPQGKAFQCR